MERDCNPRARCICTAAGFAAFVPWPKENNVLASFPVDKGDDMPSRGGAVQHRCRGD